MTYSKSSTHKVIGLGAAEDPRAGLSLPNERLTENAEALIPMINAQFIDAKVRKNIDMEFINFTVTCFMFWRAKGHKIMCFSYFFSFVPGWL